MTKTHKIIYIYFSFLTLATICGTNLHFPLLRFECFTPRKVQGCEKEGYTKSDTFFYLFTRQNPIHPEYLHNCNRKLPTDTFFNASHETIFHFHSYLSGPCVLLLWKELKDELLLRDNYNIIIADFSQSSNDEYFAAIRNLEKAAIHVVELINNIKEKGVNHTRIHLIGLSLGAHLAGLVGKNTSIGRITGLEPAGPGYYDLPSNQRLDRYDADFVDVIHTNAGRSLPRLGFLYPLGDEDFYMGDGQHQLSCYVSIMKAFFKGDIPFSISMALIPNLCFHQQAAQYFKATVNSQNCCFIGRRCNTYEDALGNSCSTSCGDEGVKCSIMGMDWPKKYPQKLKEQRIYNVHTQIFTPFCIPEETSMIVGTKKFNTMYNMCQREATMLNNS